MADPPKGLLGSLNTSLKSVMPSVQMPSVQAVRNTCPRPSLAISRLSMSLVGGSKDKGEKGCTKHAQAESEASTTADSNRNMECVPSEPPTPMETTLYVDVDGVEVPEDLYVSLLQGAERVRKRGQHRLVESVKDIRQNPARSGFKLQDGPRRRLVNNDRSTRADGMDPSSSMDPSSIMSRSPSRSE
mmetsp:Transcript_58863/g.137510  ORF Transcript_58863/g.137510 Transcript_58863/m.137510 type:complete len:187 (+) Transcript_58863:51-611(+)